jgi:hypothetical protein
MTGIQSYDHELQRQRCNNLQLNKYVVCISDKYISSYEKTLMSYNESAVKFPTKIFHLWKTHTGLTSSAEVVHTYEFQYMYRFQNNFFLS